MMGIALPSNFHRGIFFFGLILMALGLPLSKFLMSVSQFVLIGNWIAEGHIRQKWKRFWENKSAVALCSVFLLHLIGLAYTSDVNYGFKDIRIKLPLLIFPFIIASSEPLNAKQFKQLLLCFIFAVFAGTAVSIAVLFDLIHRDITDIRNISRFISYIRFSMMIDVSIFILGYYAWHETTATKKIIYGALITWFTVFLFIFNSLTSIFSLIFVLFILSCYYIFTLKKRGRQLFLGSFILLMCCLFIYYLSIVNERCGKVPPAGGNLERYTSRNNEYYHDTTRMDSENGSFVYRYICRRELDEEWNKRSAIQLDGRDKKGNDIIYTLLRYMTSKHLRKDADGLSQLSADDISNIENGVANSRYQEMISWKVRLCEVFWEIDNYRKNGNYNGHSVAQRFEFWKAGINIVKTNPLIGVGTGDVPNAFNAEYERTNSLLTKEHRLRSHNQYLSMAVAFGVIGLSWFLFSLVFPVFKEKKLFDYFYMTFFIVMLISMLTEDTLETQAGVSFYVFFNSLFLFSSSTRSG